MTENSTADNLPTEANPPGGAEQAAASVDAQLASARTMVEEQRNNYLRAVAELDNFRKRSAREIDQARKFAIERFAQELLPVLDALEAGIQAGGQSPDDALLEGVKATLRELNRAFEKAGIQTLDPQGKTFDPDWHEAMIAQECTEQPPGMVLNVVQKGYSLNGRLLRPARVIVSRAAG